MSNEKQAEKKGMLGALEGLAWEEYEAAVIRSGRVCPRFETPSPARAALREEIIRAAFRVWINREY